MHIDIGIDIGKIGPIFFRFSQNFYRGYSAFTEQILSAALEKAAKELKTSLKIRNSIQSELDKAKTIALSAPEIRPNLWRLLLCPSRITVDGGTNV